MTVLVAAQPAVRPTAPKEPPHMTAARPLRPTSGRVLRLTAVAALSSLLLACATPSAPVSKTVYDFGSPALPAAG